MKTYLTIALTAFINLYTFANPALIMNILTFEVKENNSHVEISWKTLNEFNCSYFTIEQSNDGVEWTEIMKVKALNKDKVTAYKKIHHYPESGTAFYRLKQISPSGEVTYSNIASVKVDGIDDKQFQLINDNDHLKINLNGLKAKKNPLF